eukprot:3144975-Amphidinium_carterae.1
MVHCLTGMLLWGLDSNSCSLDVLPFTYIASPDSVWRMLLWGFAAIYRFSLCTGWGCRQMAWVDTEVSEGLALRRVQHLMTLHGPLSREDG